MSDKEEPINFTHNSTKSLLNSVIGVARNNVSDRLAKKGADTVLDGLEEAVNDGRPIAFTKEQRDSFDLGDGLTIQEKENMQDIKGILENDRTFSDEEKLRRISQIVSSRLEEDIDLVTGVDENE